MRGVLFLIVSFLSSLITPQLYAKTDYKFSAPNYIIGDEFAEIQIVRLNNKGTPDSTYNGKTGFYINQDLKVLEFIQGKALYTTTLLKSSEITFKPQNQTTLYNIKIRHLPDWLSIIPPLLAIALSLIFHEVITSLFLSVFVGVLLLIGFEFSNVIPAFLRVIDSYILEVLRDSKHLSLISFAFMVGGMIALIAKNGGLTGLVNKISAIAHSSRSAQLTTLFLSLSIFFDNYVNILIVGNTMRPITDKYKVSREKLAFIVSTTAASAASLGFFTTWTGAEMVYVHDATSYLRLGNSAFSIFFKSLQYAYYPIFMLILTFALIVSRKDFNKMADAEVNARSAGIKNEQNDKSIEKNIERDIVEILHPESQNGGKWINAAFPLIVLFITAIAGLIVTGTENLYQKMLGKGIPITSQNLSSVWKFLYDFDNKNISFFQKLGELFGNGDFYIALLWSSFSSLLTAFLLTLLHKNLTLKRTTEIMIHGFRVMLSAIIILIFSWSLAEITEDLHATEYLSSVITGYIKPSLLPIVSFLLAATFAFSTGSVWGAMAILYPLLVPVSWMISASSGLSISDTESITYNVIATILSGSVFGIHCSPVSDSTIMSSIASDCNHIQHIKTQLPYAATIALISVLVFFFSLINFHWIFNLGLGTILIILIVKFSGKRVE
ncbi:Na+/H+ antiporter NhaC family protein [Sporocytophaga myxococcoides]|nr:Na+/H+ antiporter NhaC family protein [Sporocytophaga myxococcoides]